MQRTPRSRRRCILNTFGAGSLIRSVRRQQLHEIVTLDTLSCSVLDGCCRCLVFRSLEGLLSARFPYNGFTDRIALSNPLAELFMDHSNAVRSERFVAVAASRFSWRGCDLHRVFCLDGGVYLRFDCLDNLPSVYFRN